MKKTDILGVDPGIANTGWAILQCKAIGKHEVLNSNLITTKPDWNVDRRINKIADEVSQQMKKIDCVAIESVFFMQTSPSAITTAIVGNNDCCSISRVLLL